MPGRNHCQSVVCAGVAREWTAILRQERKHESVVPERESNCEGVLRTRKLSKTKSVKITKSAESPFRHTHSTRGIRANLTKTGT